MLFRSGFYRAVRKLLAQPGALYPKDLAGIDAEFRAQASRGLTAEDVILEYLGPAQNTWEPRILDELLAMPGWPGLMSQLEKDPALFPHDPVPCSLADYVAVRLTFARVAAKHVKAGLAEPAYNAEAARLTRAATLYDAARLVKIGVATVSGWSDQRWSRFVVEAESFDGLERRRVYHLAYEKWHEDDILLGMASYRRDYRENKRRLRPAAQVFFCIDEREESTRRALEIGRAHV